MDKTNTIYLRGPPFSDPIYTYQVEYHKRKEPDQLTEDEQMSGEFKLYQSKINPDVEVSFDFQGKWISCSNGLLFDPASFVPSGVLVKEVYHEQIGQVVYFLQKLSGEAVQFINHFQTTVGLSRINRMKLSQLIGLVADKYGNEVIVGRARKFFDHGEFDYSIESMSHNDYLNFAITWLEYLFTGSQNMLVDQNMGFIQPLVIQLHGQQLFLWLHLICPILASKYRDLIAKTCGRIAKMEIYQFPDGESFAIDFWQSFYLALQSFRGATEAFFNKEFGQIGTEKSFNVAMDFFAKRIKAGEITDYSNLEERFRQASYNFFLQQIEEEGRSVNETGKCSSIYTMNQISSLFGVTRETLMICTGLWTIERIRADKKKATK